MSSIKVLEFGGLGPTPFAAMMLADMGASVVRIDRPIPSEHVGDLPELDTLSRGRSSIILNLKEERQVEAARSIVAHVDVLLEGFRPGVMEHFGLGPKELMKRNPQLVYARMTGWGQDGPLAHSAGHDINYIAMTGALLAMGKAGDPPAPPLNLVGDFGAGGMLVVTGILAALLERHSSGRGQVVDAAMVDGTALLLAQVSSFRTMGHWSLERGTNLLDGGCYFYRCYECASGGFIAVGALERRFHDNFIAGLGLDPADFGNRLDKRSWAQRAAQIGAILAQGSRDHWTNHFEGIDACVTPVLSMDEAPAHPANLMRQVHLSADPASPPSPAPRFSRTPSAAGKYLNGNGNQGAATLREWGVSHQTLSLFSSDA